LQEQTAVSAVDAGVGARRVDVRGVPTERAAGQTNAELTVDEPSAAHTDQRREMAVERRRAEAGSDVPAVVLE
jgi:hypothetical protein